MPDKHSRRWRRCFDTLCVIFLLISIIILTPLTWGLDIESLDNQTRNTDSDGSDCDTGRTSRAVVLPWPMFGKNKEHSNLANTVQRGIHQAALKWDLWSTGFTGNSIDSWGSAIGNFTPNIVGVYDRNVEHVVYAENGYINIVDGSSSDLAWQLNADQIDGQTDSDLVYTTPTLGFIDDNSKLDLIFGTTDGILYMYEPIINYDSSTGYSWSANNVNSEIVWEFETAENFTQSSPVLGNINTDNFLDVAIGAGDKVFAVSGTTGSEIWNKTLSGNVVSSPVIYKDGLKNRVLATSFRQSNLNYSASFIDAESGSSLDVLYFDLGLTPNVPDLLTSPAVAELDGNTNNNAELVLCTPFEGLTNTNGKVYVYKTDRSLLWATADNAITGQIDATPALADLDSDGKLDVVILSWAVGTLGPVTHIYAFNGNNGTLMWHVTKDTVGVPQPPYTNERAVASPILADLNDNGKPDVLFPTSPQLFAVSGLNGSDLWDISLQGSGRQLWSSPAAGDIDKDGFLDVVLDGAAISHVIIDLTMSLKDFSLSSENITENQQVTIQAIIHNNGSASASSVKASFFDNDILIGNKTENSIPAYDSREFRMNWVPDVDGKRTLKVVIDPDATIEEIREDNNDLEIDVNVLPSFPDLIIDDVKYYRGDGKEVDNNKSHMIAGEDATIKISAKNIGDDEAEQITVSAKDSGKQIGTDKKIKILDVQEIKELIYTFSAPAEGNHDLTFSISLDNSGLESNTTNNDFNEQVIVVGKIPANPSFICNGVVYKPDNGTPAADVEVRFTNNRTGLQIVKTTDSSGHYAADLKNLPGLYNEGDEIIIFASDSENATSISFIIYSEDRERFDNISLVKVPTFAVSISVDDANLDILPNGEVNYKLTVTNRGNEENNVNLTITDIIGVNTEKPLTNWSASLNDYFLTNIPPKGSLPVILSIEAPAKRTEARAKDQVLVAVIVTSTLDTSQVDIVGTTTTVKRIYDFSISMVSTNLKLDPMDNMSLKFNAKLKNDGNDDDTVKLNLETPSSWVAEYDPSLDLLLGEEKEVEITLTRDTAQAAGKYTFYLNLTSIDNMGNTSQKFSVEVERPDIVFSENITMTPAKPVLSKSISFEAIVKNSGSAVASMFLLEFWVNDDFISSEKVINLSTNEQIRLTFQWTPTSTGKYTLNFKIDPQMYLIELDTDNNLQTLQLDFFTDITIKDEPKFSNDRPTDGDKITISVVVENVGNVDITESFTVDFYNGDPVSGILIESYTVSDELPLKVGDDIDIPVQWKAKGKGQHTISIEVNSDHEISESNYDNNSVEGSLVVLEKQGTEYDSSFLIAIVFIIAIVLIIFIVMMPSKQPTDKDKKKGKGKGKGKGSGKGKKGETDKSKKGGSIKGKKDSDAKDKDKKKGKQAIKKKVKFVEVSADDEKALAIEDSDLEKDTDGAEVDEDESEDEPGDEEEEEATTTKARRKKPKKSFSDKVTKALGGLISGRRLPVSKSKSGKSTEELDEDEEPDEELEEEVLEAEDLEEVEALDEIEPEMIDAEDELEDVEVEVAEVEVVEEEPVDDDDVEAEEVEELEDEDEDEKDEDEEDEETDSGLDYSHMIGIR